MKPWKGAPIALWLIQGLVVHMLIVGLPISTSLQFLSKQAGSRQPGSGAGLLDGEGDRSSFRQRA